MSGEPDSKKTKVDEPLCQEGILFTYGNPLLDISADIDSDLEFLTKYGLKANDACLAEDKHKAMYDDMCNTFEVEYVPGGATLNSTRAAQWLLGTPKATTFVGCVGKDKYGKILEEKATEEGVNVRYQINDKEPTGTCAVLCSDKGRKRSLCAYLAAANCFTKDHIDVPENRALIEKAKFYYIAGYPLTVCPDAMVDIGKHASKNNKIFTFNLSAPFLCQFFKEQMMKVMPYADIVFGNEGEAATFSKEHDFKTEDLKEIAEKIANLPKENKTPRTVVITQGHLPTLVYRDGKVTEYPVIPIKAEDIVDTNGAGDAFVGGFLAQLVQDKSIEECVRCGAYAAHVIIQRSGCTLPAKPDFK